jgi:hypothetical protein
VNGSNSGALAAGTGLNVRVPAPKLLNRLFQQLNRLIEENI